MTSDITQSNIYGVDFQSAPKRSFYKVRRVLIVEDDAVLSRLIQATLERQGYKAEIAEDGVKALEMLRQSRQPSIVLLDLTLPFHDGFEILTEMRQNAEWRDVPVIVLTANKDLCNTVRAFDGGANDYVVKPIRLNELVARINCFAD